MDTQCENDIIYRMENLSGGDVFGSPLFIDTFERAGSMEIADLDKDKWRDIPVDDFRENR